MTDHPPEPAGDHLGQFAADVKDGLQDKPKHFPSLYFYDDEGSRLFQQIMHMPEYYLFDCELEIFKEKAEEMCKNIFSEEDRPVEIIELGAGDGLKTIELLKEIDKHGSPFSYLPIDISEEAINQISKTLLEQLPELKISGIVAEYFDGLEQIRMSNSKKVILFLGSNLGNFPRENATSFLKAVNDRLDPGDLLLLGTDLRKHPRIIIDAYDDKQGITRAFNMNLLKRINRELDANFDLDHFEHYPMYDPETGEARSYIISTREQDVTIGVIGETFHFDKWEMIHTEISKKYSYNELNELAEKTGFTVADVITDKRQYFADSFWEKR
ncbi:L-histidine N(alpha)-methyltransferase [Halocola ammonii]